MYSICNVPTCSGLYATHIRLAVQRLKMPRNQSRKHGGNKAFFPVVTFRKVKKSKVVIENKGIQLVFVMLSLPLKPFTVNGFQDFPLQSSLS